MSTLFQPRARFSRMNLNYLRVKRTLARKADAGLAEFETGSNVFRYLSSQSMSTFYLIASLLVIVVFGIPWEKIVGGIARVLRGT